MNTQSIKKIVNHYLKYADKLLLPKSGVRSNGCIFSTADDKFHIHYFDKNIYFFKYKKLKDGSWGGNMWKLWDEKTDEVKFLLQLSKVKI